MIRIKENANLGFKNRNLVTREASNPELGIEHIGLRLPNTNKAGSPLFKMQLELSHGVVIFGDIFANRNGNGINVRYPQDTYTDAQGVTQYADKVRVPMAITAQVIAYATTLLEVTDAPVPQATQAPQQNQAPQQTQQTQAPQQQAQTQVPVGAGNISNNDIEDYINSIM